MLENFFTGRNVFVSAAFLISSFITVAIVVLGLPENNFASLDGSV